MRWFAVKFAVTHVTWWWPQIVANHLSQRSDLKPQRVAKSECRPCRKAGGHFVATWAPKQTIQMIDAGALKNLATPIWCGNREVFSWGG
jgi:hypothetical protein